MLDVTVIYKCGVCRRRILQEVGVNMEHDLCIDLYIDLCKYRYIAHGLERPMCVSIG